MSRRAGLVLVGLLVLAAVATTISLLPSLDPSGSTPRLGQPDVVVAGVSLHAAPDPRAVLNPPRTSSRTGGGLDTQVLHHLLSRAVRSNALGSAFELAVDELPTGDSGPTSPIFEFGGSDPVTPASLLKLLTVTAALSVLGPEHRFKTSVVSGVKSSDLVLVGGGDPLLTGSPLTGPRAVPQYPTPASLDTLARRTATRMRQAGVHRVHLRYDASLFSGPAVNPTWPRSYLRDFVVSPISALEVDKGRVKAGRGPRVEDPAATAAEKFADRLRARGIAVTGRVAASRVRHSASLVASVESPPLRAIGQHIIEMSDNEGAEVLLRQVALGSGRSGSSRAGIEAVKAALTGLGLDLSGVKAYDGSGLSRADRLPLTVLLDVLQLAADPNHPELSFLLTSLPVAGFTGTLAYRFTDDAPDGLGLVRAKTGTLTGVHGMAGLVVTASGRPVLFAAVADSVPKRRTLDARDQLDRIAALLASCRCDH